MGDFDDAAALGSSEYDKVKGTPSMRVAGSLCVSLSASKSAKRVDAFPQLTQDSGEESVFSGRCKEKGNEHSTWRSSARFWSIASVT